MDHAQKLNTMKILQTIGGMNAMSGGPSTCTYDLLKTINQLPGHPTVDLLAVGSATSKDRILGIGEDWFKSVDYDYKTPLAYSFNISKYLESSDYDIYHTNGIWMHVNHQTCLESRKKGKPYIISTHGMLYQSALRRNYWKKWPMLKLWFEKDIRNATCCHATCVPEMHEIRKFGYGGPIAVIGNPVDVPEFSMKLLEDRINNQKNKHGLKIGFLGRLHPIKKIENLIKALALFNKKEVNLIIIGSGDKDYEDYLKSEINNLKLTSQVKLIGFVNGQDKYQILSNLDCLFVPSEMENFGMIVPESLIVGTPVMASYGTPWKSLQTENCGWWADNSPNSIVKILDELYNMSPLKNILMGIRGRKYILQEFSSEKVATKMIELYKWILEGGEKPENVYE